MSDYKKVKMYHTTEIIKQNNTISVALPTDQSKSSKADMRTWQKM